MHVDLLGFLLGALEPDEMDQVRQALREDAKLREQLEQLRQSLRPLETSQFEPMETDKDLTSNSTQGVDSPTPPSDLVSQTLQGIWKNGGPPVSGQTLDSASAQLTHTCEKTSRHWLDLIASGLAITALLGIVLPAILHGRYEFRVAACQDNLRRIGIGLVSYAMGEPNQEFPRLATEGPEAFAGIYAVRLYEQGLMPNPETRWCPSYGPPPIDTGTPATSTDLATASNVQRVIMQRFSGGSYAYSLGTLHENRYSAPRYSGRSSFAILGDSLRVSPLTSDASRTLPSEHNGRGVNLLFEDGHVVFASLNGTTTPAISTSIDHPFVNHFGQVEAGVNLDDAILAPSWKPPFLDTAQHSRK